MEYPKYRFPQAAYIGTLESVNTDDFPSEGLQGHRFWNVWACVCVGFVMCACFGNTCTCIYSCIIKPTICTLLNFILTTSSTCFEQASYSSSGGTLTVRAVYGMYHAENIKIV